MTDKIKSCPEATREFIRDQQFSPMADGIRRYRHAIAALPAGHPARSVLAGRDFYSLDEFRDLVMHVQEHRFTLPQIAECLDHLELRFLGFQHAPAMLNRFKANAAAQAKRFDIDTIVPRYEMLYNHFLKKENAL